MRSATEQSIQKANKQLLAAIRKLPQQPLIVAGVLAGFAFFGSFFLLSSQAAAPGTETAYFALEGADKAEPFIVALQDPAKIQAAREFRSKPWTITGIIVRERADYNAGWGYHLDPTTVEFVERPGDSCNVAAGYIEQHLAQVGDSVLPGGRWCPAGVTSLREVSK